MEKFSKPFTTHREQLEKIQQRGLIISDLDAAESFLSYCNYYRFSGYVLAFEHKKHVLWKNTTFENVRDLYEFDRNLRFLVSEAIAVIEISMRSRLANELGRSNDPFLHRNRNIFQRERLSDWDKCYDKMIDETERSQELFVEHFKNKYEEYPHLPIWVLTELISFGSLSKFYTCLQPKYQKAISKHFCVPRLVLISWLHTLTYTRNLCAHHSRLWDRKLSVPSKVPDDHTEFECFRKGTPTWRLFCVLSIIKFLLDKIKERVNVDIGWSQRIVDLLTNHPTVPNFEREIGMPDGWKQMDLWETQTE